MGKKLRDEDLVLNVIINGNKAKKELGDLEQSTRELKSTNKDLRLEKEKLKRAGKQESERYKEINAELKANNASIKKNEARIKELRSVMGAAGMTMAQLRKEARRLQLLLDNATYGTENWKRYRAELDKVEAQMGKVKAKGKGMNRTLGKIADGFNKFSVMGAAVVASLTGIVFAIKEWVNGMVSLSDELADIMKTTGMTKKEVRELNGEFKNLNTRTSRKELRGLAEEAGRLGKKSKKEVMDFVEVANQIAVALGDDLGDTKKAVREVGKLTNIYKVGARYGTGFKDSMSKIGSAINEVSANSSAQADYLIGYLKRMGGMAAQADVNASQILGYASALDQLGQTQEMAATAQGKVMIDMFTDTAKYAEIAKIETSDFAQLLETDANEAFLKMLEGLNGNNEGMTIMAKKLDDLGIDGSRAVQVLSTLAKNTDLVRKEQELANDSMDKGVSLINEYRIRNENFAASISKISKYIKGKLINSSFLGWIEKVAGKMAEWTKADPTETLKNQHSEMNKLVMQITSLNQGNELRSKLLDKLTKNYPEYWGQIDKTTISNDKLLTSLQEVNRQMIRSIYIQGRKKELEELQTQASEKLAVELKYRDQLETLKTSYFKKMGKTQQDLFTGDFDFIIQHFRKLKQESKTNVEWAMKTTGWLERQKLGKQHKGGLEFSDLIDLSGAYGEWKEAYKVRYRAQQDAEKEKGRINKYEKMWGLDDNPNEGGQKNSTSETPPKKGDSEPNLAEQQKFGKLHQQLKDELAKAGYANLKDGIEKETAFENQRWEEEQTKLEEKLIYKQKLSDQEKAYNADVRSLEEKKLKAHTDRLDELKKADEERKTAEKALKEAEEAEIKLLEAETEDEEFQAKMNLAQVRYDQELAAAEDNRLKKIQAKKKYDSEVDKINADRDNKELQRIIKNKELTLQKLDLAKQALGVMRTLAGEETALGKALFVAQQAIAVAQMIVNTALANTKAVAASPLTFGQPWVTINTISGGLGVASALAQTITGLESGGYTDVVRAQDGKPYRAQIRRKRGFVDKPSVLVGEEKSEFVASGAAVENPTVKPILDIIDYHQRAGDIHSLDLNSVFSTMPSMRGYESGGYTQAEPTPPPSTPADDNSITSILQQSTATTQELNDILKKGVRAIIVYKELEEMEEEVEAIKNAANL